MGILAPLDIAEDQPSQLTLTTGYNTLKTGIGLIAFAAVTGLMWWITKPLLRPEVIADPWLTKALPDFLLALSPTVAVLGLLTVGYRKAIRLNGDQRMLVSRLSFWGVPVVSRRVPFADIQKWIVRNVTPKRYRADTNLKRRPVGYWDMALQTASGEIHLDRAPREGEIRSLCDKMQSFVATHAKRI